MSAETSAVTSVTPADGPSLGTAPCRHMQVDLGVAQPLGRDAERVRVGAHPGERCLRRFAHHVAELAGQAQAQALAAGQHGGLDEQDVAAVVGVREPDDDAGLGGALGSLGQVRRRAERLLDESGVDLQQLRRRGGAARARHPPRRLAQQRGDEALQIANAGLAGVVVHHALQRLVVDCDLGRGEPVRLELARHQVPPRDLQLVAPGVAGQLDHLHAVEQRRRDRRQRIRGGDEHHLREVEGDLDVVVAERVVLLRIEHLEQRGRRVAAEVDAQLVDLVEQEDRIARAGAAQALEDAAGQRADVGAAMAADLGLVAHAAERRASELASQRARDRAAERRLADAGRADEAEDRTLRRRRELAYREELENAVLHLLEIVVVRVEDVARGLQVEPIFGLFRPRQVDDPLDVGPDQVAVRRVLGQGGEPLQLALGLRARDLRQVRGLELLAQLLRLADARVLLADLALDVAQALAQQALAMLRIHLLVAGRLGERALRLGDRDLAL